MIRSNNGEQIINQIPINRIFVESDGPFTKVLGRKYTIEKLSTVYEELVHVKRSDEVEILIEQISQNYLSLVNK